LKQIGKHESDEYGLVLGIFNDIHSYLMTVNLLRYQKEHVKNLLLFQPTFELDKSLCMINLSYLMALRVLEQVDFPLDRNIYYNIHSHVVSAEQNEFADLVIALEEVGFLFKCCVKKELDSDINAVIKRQL
jgi:hypothetical protein